MSEVDQPEIPGGGTPRPVAAAELPYDGEDVRAWIVVGTILAAAIAALTGIFAGTAALSIDNWHQASFNHGFLILPISLYVAWERRGAFLPLRPRPTLWGLLPAVGSAALWMIGEAVDVNIVKQAALLGLVLCMFFSVLGWRLTWVLLFPLLYLLLMLPLGESMYPVLQDVATRTSVFFLGLTSLPVYNEDTVVQVPSGVYRIAIECSGLNFLLATIALSLLYGRLMYSGWLKPLLCVAVMIPLAVLGNGFRIFLIIYANHFFGAHIDIVADHYFYGWGFIAIILFLMMWVGLAFRDPEPVYQRPDAPAPWGASSLSPLARLAGVAAVVIVFAAAAPTWSAYRAATMPPPPAVALSLPSQIGPWSETAARPAVEAWVPAFPDADAAVLKTYAAAGRPTVDLFVAYYASQGPEKEVVSYRNVFSQYNDWIRRGGGQTTAMIDGQPQAVVEERLSKASVPRLLWYVYWVDGRLTSSDHMAKALQAKADLLGGDRRAAFVGVSVVEPGGGREDARAALQAFLDALSPVQGLLEGATPQTR